MLSPSYPIVSWLNPHVDGCTQKRQLHLRQSLQKQQPKTASNFGQRFFVRLGRCSAHFFLGIPHSVWLTPLFVVTPVITRRTLLSPTEKTEVSLQVSHNVMRVPFSSIQIGL